MSAKIMHKTWWGKEFVSALEAYIEPGRLQRGKAYRTDKRVLDFKIKGGEIQATLRGNVNPYFGVYKEPKYKVQLKFKQISQAQWQEIIQNISSNALWLSKLMLNEIPSDIESAFGSENLLPASYKSVKASCNCPDYGDPCKHIAGIYYRIAEMLDTNPMLLFQLRGLPPEKLHQELRKTELGRAFSEQLTLPDSVEMEYQNYKYTSCYSKQDKKTRVNNAKQFWSMPTHISEQNTKEHLNEHAVNSEITAALIKKQGDYPTFWTKNNSFITAMELFYSYTRKKNSKDLF